MHLAGFIIRILEVLTETLGENQVFRDITKCRLSKKFNDVSEGSTTADEGEEASKNYRGPTVCQRPGARLCCLSFCLSL